ncbi:MAG: hypothetical protein K6T17_01155 [Fimbriimonadales bacterium]|nr:hypothetical protein [Fimbriimonadales bacterium]
MRWHLCRVGAFLFASAGIGSGFAQIPDLLSFFEMGGRGAGMGGALYSNATDVSASFWNPAGLRWVRQASGEFNFRNRPTTDTRLTGTFVDPDRDGRVGYGSEAFTFAGIAYPMKNGTLGFSFAVGGYAREFARNDGNLSSGDPNDPTFVDRQIELLRVVTEFYTLAWGTERGSLGLGIGLVAARQSISDRMLVRTIPGGTGDPVETSTDFSDSAVGFGGIVGIQYAPPGANYSFGVSYRTEINLDTEGGMSLYTDKVPARIQAGVVWRVDGLRGGEDFLIGGIDAAFFPKVNENRVLSRDDQFTGGIGLEYNIAQPFGYLPLRFGYRGVEKAADGFSDRNVFTFGVGYRPHREAYAMDLSFAVGSGQRRPDVMLSVSFLIGG